MPDVSSLLRTQSSEPNFVSQSDRELVDQFIDALNGGRTSGESGGANQRARYSGNTSQDFGTALADQFVPDDRTAQNLFRNAQDLGTLQRTTSPPEDRFRSGYANAGDTGFQREASNLVAQGVIGPGTFVLSDTGHDIPMMQTLMSELDMSGTLSLPPYDPNVTGNGSRVAGQAETWGNEIAALDARNSADGSVDSYFLGIDTHRNETGRVDASKLPSAQQLRDAGVTKIVYLAESAPGQYGIEGANSDVTAYLQSLRQAGIEVDVRGVDYRQGAGRRPSSGGSIFLEE